MKIIDNAPLDILYLDNHLLVVNKPAGLLVQGDHTKKTTLFDKAKKYLKVKYNKPGNVFLGLVHRLDRQVSGVVVLARTSKAASRLAEQFRLGSVKKSYNAIVEGTISNSGIYTDYIIRNGSRGIISKNKTGKFAELNYQRIKTINNFSRVKINLITGRHHQIRVQFSHRGHPILGDARYGAKHKFVKQYLALHAQSLCINHPTTRKPLIFEANYPSFWKTRLT